MHPVPLMTHSAVYTCRIVKGATRECCRSVDFRSSQIARGPDEDIFLNEPPPVARHRRYRQRFFSRGVLLAHPSYILVFVVSRRRYRALVNFFICNI